ncbi:hypothetical protein ACFXOS_07095 [Streptomyces sp. NPDC059175]|uniref:hypothetical protein n=1 Tax=Streptomyces sp. NPDC059175 TaxID=3346757 RepID=UPI00368AA6B6
MIALVRTRTLRALRAEALKAQEMSEEYRKEAECVTDAAIRAEIIVEEVRAALARASANTARLEGELNALRAQSLLDTEDRQALRTLLRITRKQRTADRVYALFHHGQLHSVHATVEEAELAAEAEGASPSGWTAHTPGAALPPAADVLWRVQPLPLGTPT